MNQQVEPGQLAVRGKRQGSAMGVPSGQLGVAASVPMSGFATINAKPPGQPVGDGLCACVGRYWMRLVVQTAAQFVYDQLPVVNRNSTLGEAVDHSVCVPRCASRVCDVDVTAPST